MLIRWDPRPAIAAAVGDDEAGRFLAADDVDFLAWNHLQDSGRSWDEGEAELARTHPHWAEHARAYRAHFDLSLRGAIDGNVAVLHDLVAAGVPVVALTNWSAELFPVARRRFDFLALFEDIVVSGDEGVAKPDPAIFERLRHRLGRPLPACVLVDDSEVNVRAAREAGMHAEHLPLGRPLRPLLSGLGLPV